MRNPSLRCPRLGVRLAALALLVAMPPFLAACGGGGGGSAGAGAPPTDVPPTGLQYASSVGLYRVGQAATPIAPTLTAGTATSFTINPALPAGLAFDTVSGALSGTPTTLSARTAHAVTAINEFGTDSIQLDVAVGPVLPSSILSLDPGFIAVQELTGGIKVAKAVMTPGGRIIFTEVNTGNLRIIDSQNGGLQAAPYANLTVTNGGFQGLLGLVLSPNFVIDGYVYVQATVPGATAQDPDQTVVMRYTDDPANNVAVNQVVMVSGLPVSNLNNGGDLVFDLEGHLLMSIGDNEAPGNAQAPFVTSAAGKILRYDVSTAPAGIPANNPDPASPEWCRGLRNTFGLAVHPTLGTTIGADNGPTNNDEINLIQSGRNYEWGAAGAVQNPGRRIVVYNDVIVPTALAWHTGTNLPTAYANNLFLTSYADQKVRRLLMSGPTLSDFDGEVEFMEFALEADDNKPLDIFVTPDGSIYVVTFTGIWRIGPI